MRFTESEEHFPHTVVVCDPVFKEEHLVPEILHKWDWTASLVAVEVVVGRGQRHVALRVDGVVEVPRGHRGDAHAAAEHALRVLPQRHEGGVAAVGPAPNAHATRVDEGEPLRELFGDGDLVLDLDSAEVPVSGKELLDAVEARSSAVDFGVNDAVVRDEEFSLLGWSLCLRSGLAIFHEELLPNLPRCTCSRRYGHLVCLDGDGFKV